MKKLYIFLMYSSESEHNHTTGIRTCLLQSQISAH